MDLQRCKTVTLNPTLTTTLKANHKSNHKHYPNRNRNICNGQLIFQISHTIQNAVKQARLLQCSS